MYKRLRFKPRHLSAHSPVALLLRSLILAALLLAHLAVPAQAQSTAIRFNTLSIDDGLSQSTVHAIEQDSYGFMWFGTDDGLNKYDGYTFTVYKHDAENPDSLLDNTIQDIHQDTHGQLWIGTSKGLELFVRDSETFQHFQHNPSSEKSLQGYSVDAIAEDSYGNLWVGTSDGGLNLLNRGENTFTRYPHSPSNLNTPASDSVLTLLADNKGGLWIGTSQGLDYLDVKAGKFTHHKHDSRDPTSINDNEINTLFLTQKGMLWIGTEAGGLDRMRLSDGAITHFTPRPYNPRSLSSNLVQSIYEDQNGNLWVGGRSGLNLFDPTDESFTRYQHNPNDPRSLSNDYVLSIFADHSGVLWIGTFGGGLSKYVQNNARFTLYQHQPGVPTSLSRDVVYSIAEGKDGSVWVGTMDGGLNRLNPDAGTFSLYQNNQADPGSLGNNDVRAILEDRQGVLWVGTYGGGLNRFDRDTSHFDRFTHNQNNPLTISDDRVMALFEDSHGNLWIGTREGGLNLFDRITGQFIHYRHDPNNQASLIDDFVRTISEDRAGNLWVGTNNGISVMDPKTHQFHNYQYDRGNPLSLSDNRVLSVLETADGTVWIGTLLGGLNRFDRATQTFYHYTQKQGLPSDTVYGILADQLGFLWLSTNRGLSRFDRSSETVRNYDRQDGLQSYEFNAGAYCLGQNGLMYFGGVQGFNVFNPARMQDNPLPPKVIITAFKKFNQTTRKDLPENAKIKLSYQDNFISFEFAALDFNAPEKNQYAYMLEGFDKQWINAGTRRYASYTNLRGGHYTFRVIGSNQDGVWNETGASLEITVVPPIWENWWFIGSIALVVMGGSFGGYRLRMMSIQAQNRYLENQIHDRTQESERRREVAEGLREILTILNSNRSLRESLDVIIAQIVRLMGANSVMIFRSGQEHYPAIVANNLPEMNIRPNEQAFVALPEWIAQPLIEGRRLYLPDLSDHHKAHPELEESPFGQYAALLAMPIVVNDKIDGGLILLYKKPRIFSEEDIQMALSFANHAALAIANAQLRSQSEEIAVLAERSRLARDLHDAVTQTLFATSLIAEVLPKLWERNPEAGKQKITEIRELTRGALAEMRTLLMELRPTALLDMPLPDLLQQLSEAFTGRARVPVKLEVDKSIELPIAVKIGFYRITQEALNNIQKHSRASHVEIRLCENGDDIELTICDDGVGFDQGRKLPDHFGLGIMEERAQSIGARFSLETQPGKGTQIFAAWKAVE